MAAGEPKAPTQGGRGPDGPLLAWTGWAITALEWSGKVIAAGALGFMFVALLVNVVLRYAFGSGIPWAYEIHALLLPWLVSGGIVIAAARSRNIAITLLPELAPRRALSVVLLTIEVAIVVIAVSVLWSSQPILKASTFQTLSTLGIKQVWGYSSLVYAFASMSVIAVLNILRIFGGSGTLDTDPTHASLS